MNKNYQALYHQYKNEYKSIASKINDPKINEESVEFSFGGSEKNEKNESFVDKVKYM